MSFASIFFEALPYVVAMLLALLLGTLMIWFQSRFIAGAMAAMLTVAANSILQLSTTGIKLGVALYIPDFTFALIAAATVFRLVTLREARIGVPAFLVLAGVMCFNLAVGLMQNGSAAGTAARPTFYAMATCAYALSFPMTSERVRELTRVLLVGGVLLGGLAVFRGIVVAFDIRSLLPASGSFQPAEHSAWRVILSNDALLLGELALLLWFHYAVSPSLRSWRWMAVLLLGSVIALQHRSVWLATLSGLLAVQAFALRREAGMAALGRQMLPLILVLGVVAAGVKMAGSGEGLGGDIAKSTSDALALKGTAGERLSSWQQVVQQWSGSGPRGIALGRPFGESSERYTSDDLGARKIAYEPHNYYVEVLWNQGAVGLLAWLWLYGQALRGAWRARRSSDPQLAASAGMLGTMIACQAVYYLTYGIDTVQALMLGVTLVLARSSSPEPGPHAFASALDDSDPVQRPAKGPAGNERPGPRQFGAST